MEISLADKEKSPSGSWGMGKMGGWENSEAGEDGGMIPLRSAF